MFTVKHVVVKPGGNLSQNVYSCSSYEHETRGTMEAGPKSDTDQYGPMITLRADDDYRVICFGEDEHIYVENDRGKTVDHFKGTEWLAWSCYDAKEKLWRDPRVPGVI